ncbi:hypothetical protein EXS70_00530 [Candidatus Peribacteria bacterium]|nr:hypothetical protein [Candidatus Peribacteria bacterium]
MRLLPRIILSALFLTVPAAAFAMTEAIWDFRQESLPGEWRVSNLDLPTMTSDGLHVTAKDKPGSMLTQLSLPHATEVISIHFVSNGQIDARLFWHEHVRSEDQYTELNITIPNGESTLDLNVDAYAEWDRHTDSIGLAFPQGTDLLLQEIRFVHWNALEKIAEVWRSFWKFDTMSPISINFVWGPVVEYNPLGTVKLFTELPPRGRSGNWIFFFALLAIAVVITLYRYVAVPRMGMKQFGHPLVLFLLAFGGLWVLYDIRMGLELLSYAKNDYDLYISQPQGRKIFRNYQNFNDIMEQSAPYLKDGVHFGLLMARDAPVDSMVRYFALPAIMELPTEPNNDLRYWLMFRRNDVTVDAENRLSVGGVPWSPPGRIVTQFDPNSFLFEVTP